MDNNAEINGGSLTDAPVGELVKWLSEQTSRLAHREVELAKAELVVQGKRVEAGLEMFGGAGAIGFYALVAAAVLGLATAVSAWLSALIIALVLGAIAGLLALHARDRGETAVDRRCSTGTVAGRPRQIPTFTYRRVALSPIRTAIRFGHDRDRRLAENEVVDQPVNPTCRPLSQPAFAHLSAFALGRLTARSCPCDRLDQPGR